MNRIERLREGSATKTSWIGSVLRAGIGSSMLMILLIGWSWGIGGKGLADRAMTDLVMPIGLIWITSLTLALTGYFRRERGILLLGFGTWCFISFGFTDPIADAFLRTVEISADRPPAEELDAPADVVVLLGGYGYVNRFGTLELGNDGQRLLLTAQLWNAGKTKAIICTGSAHFGDYHPSRVGRELLVSIGVPNEIIYEVPGINTSTEMLNLKAFFREPPESLVAQLGKEPERLALVTTASHLKRAMRLAETQGLRFIPVGCSFSGTAEPTFSPRFLIPKASAGVRFSRAVKEWLAWLVGR
ncbi:MAG: YdcF family protein [Planctomycetota bacterium]